MPQGNTRLKELIDPGKVLAGQYVPDLPVGKSKVLAGRYQGEAFTSHGKVLVGAYTELPLTKPFNPNVVLS